MLPGASVAGTACVSSDRGSEWQRRRAQLSWRMHSYTRIKIRAFHSAEESVASARPRQAIGYE